MANYEEILVDKYTGERALIKSNDRTTFSSKKKSKLEVWEKRHQRNLVLKAKEEVKKNAEELNSEVQDIQKSMKNILIDSLHEKDYKIDWETLKHKKAFQKFKFLETPPFIESYLKNVPQKSFIEVFIKSRTEKRLLLEKEANEEYKRAQDSYNEKLENAKQTYESDKAAYIEHQVQHNIEIDNFKNSFESGEVESVERYANMVVNASKFPEAISLNFDIFYVSDRRTLIVNVDLPSPDDVPKEIEYKYVSTKNEISVKLIKDKEFKILYNNLIGQIAIKILHELFVSIYPDLLDFIVLNGNVSSINTKTGQEINNCILSIQANKDYFETLNLEKIDPLDCISGMKGVVASEFINLAPVKPILNLNREDHRIIESDEIIDAFDMSNNLADMEWQKFEVLVRDLFSKEFSGDGVDVKVTQASRDAGVDAIIFDPDPIKGGKFVIQAKRYNNVVGVSAVRDLYGTVMNEGAVKGILVTTSNYGKDSIEFAKDKPLTLISGAELVHLFNKHGYDVVIQTRKKVKEFTQ